MSDVVKPLSGRLVNEQGVVIFLLYDIYPVKVLEDRGFGVHVKEADQEYAGIVKLLEGKRGFKDLVNAIEEYNKFLEQKEEYDKMSDSMKATHGPLKVVEPVTVQINRVTHDQFPFMQ